jgi:hypothetical protein
LIARARSARNLSPRESLQRDRQPAELIELDEAGVPDGDALLLEQLALDGGADRVVNRDPAAQLARLADHALPRQPAGAR